MIERVGRRLRHTYLGTSGAKEKQRKALGAEYARMASETGGQAFTSQDTLNAKCAGPRSDSRS